MKLYRTACHFDEVIQLRAIQAAKSKDFTVDVESPEELLEWMDSIDYGWMDEDYEAYDKIDDDDFWDNYSMLLPHEVFKHKKGVCWDQTIFENYVFDKEFDYEHHMIFIQQYKVGTHTFLVYKDDDQWYWFEHAFNDHKGIHGPYDSVEDIVVDVYDNIEEPDGTGYAWTVMNPDDFKKKLTCKEFMDLCDYNYDEMEESNRKESEKVGTRESRKVRT